MLWKDPGISNLGELELKRNRYGSLTHSLPCSEEMGNSEKSNNSHSLLRASVFQAH